MSYLPSSRTAEQSRESSSPCAVASGDNARISRRTSHCRSCWHPEQTSVPEGQLPAFSDVNVTDASPKRMPVQGMPGPEQNVMVGIDLSPLPSTRMLRQKGIHSGFVHTSTHGSWYISFKTFPQSINGATVCLYGWRHVSSNRCAQDRTLREDKALIPQGHACTFCSANV